MEYNEESIFNMALAYLKRIDKMLYLADINSMQGNVMGWLNALSVVYRELSIRLTDDERKEIDGEQKDLEFIIKNLDKCINFKCINVLCNNQIYLIKYKKYVMYLLDKLEIKLRILMQVKGMLLPSKDDPRRAITRR